MPPSSATGKIDSPPIPLWSRDQEQICAEIARNSSRLKILLKTKDDSDLLGAWLQHHGKIVGPDSLIVFDNMSTDEQTLNIYRDIGGAVPVYQFDGFHNLIHHTHYYAPLYDALRRSCSYFAFLDADERLVLFDGDDRFDASGSVLQFLDRNGTVPVFPGTWLQNVTGHSDRFGLYDPVAPLKSGLKWGKPIISTNCRFDEMINHNTQLKHDLFTAPLTTNFFVLHLSRLSIRQRIGANMKKLRKYGAIPEDGDLTYVLELDASSLSHRNIHLYVKEIQDLSASGVSELGDIGGSIKIAEDGALTCAAPWQHAALRNFIAEPSLYTEELFSD